MTDVLLILTLGLFFVFGFRMMSRLDRFIASAKGRNPDRTVAEKKMPTLRKALLMYVSGESLRSIFAGIKQRRKEKNEPLRKEDLTCGEAAQLFLHRPHKG